MIASAPKEKDAWFAARLFYLGYALHHWNRNQEAVDVLSKFIEYQVETNAYSVTADTRGTIEPRALIALDRIPEAVTDLTAAIEIAPAAELHELRATAYESLGNAESAWRPTACGRTGSSRLINRANIHSGQASLSSANGRQYFVIGTDAGRGWRVVGFAVAVHEQHIQRAVMPRGLLCRSQTSRALGPITSARILL